MSEITPPSAPIPPDHSRPTAPALLVGIGLVFIGGLVQPIVQDNFLTGRVLIFILAAAACFVAAFRWRKYTPNPGALRASFEKIANNAKVWLFIALFVWLWNVTDSALKEVRLNNEVVALRNDEQSIAKVIDRLVIPRHLSTWQKNSIANYLSQFDSVEYSFVVAEGDEEASTYRGEIEQVLDRGHWTKAANYISYSQKLPNGLGITVLQGPLHGLEDPKRMDAYKIIRSAFGLAGVRVDGQCSEAGATDTAHERIVICIGAARRDWHEMKDNE